MTDVLFNACRSLWRKRARSMLTVLGIVIGVALVTVVTLIGDAGRYTVGGELESMGLGGLSVTASGRATLEEDGLRALRRMGSVSSAVPLMVHTASTTAADGTAQSLMLCGIDSGEVQAIGLTRLHGRMLSVGDVAAASHVCVVDTAVATALYGRENILGRTVTVPIAGIEETFTVVGVTKAGSLLFQNVAQMIPGMVYIPYTTLQQLTGRTDFDQLAVRLASTADAAAEAVRIEQALAQVSGEVGFRAEDLSAQKDKLSGLMDIVTWILTAISAISLLVSGLSIMTIMMVSVGERTREIGVKKALGATDGRIRREFLAEALLLSLGGGVCGVVLGLLLGQLGLSLVGVSLPSISPLWWLIAFAAVIGVAFGVYPAHKAAHLDPVDALRCE